MPSSLPVFSRGLKLVRLAVFVMLLQIALGVVLVVKITSAHGEGDARNALDWLQYTLLLNAGAAVAMLVGVGRAIPELVRVKMDVRALVVSALGFAIAAASLVWTYHVLNVFLAVLTAPVPDFERIAAAVKDLEWVGRLAVVKDVAYGLGLYLLIRTVRISAAVNDQLALRDEAGSMSRALLVMIVVDFFYQLTYGLGTSGGPFGIVGALAIGLYWVYCHWRLQRFLFNAAWFVNEPHNLPVATLLISADKPKKPPARPSQPIPRPSQPAPKGTDTPPPPLAIVAPPPRVEPPRAQSEHEPNGPRFLR